VGFPAPRINLIEAKGIPKVDPTYFRIVAQILRRTPLHDFPMIHDIRAVRNAQSFPHVMIGDQHADTRPAELAIKNVKDGKFKAEDYGKYSTMKYKGSELAPLGTFASKVPADVVKKVKGKEKAIVDGAFTVEVVESEP